MRIILFFSLLLLGSSTLVSCQSTKAQGDNGIPVSIVFEKWNLQFGQLQSMDLTLKGNNKSGEAVAVPTQVRINQYDEFLLPMLTELEDKGQFKDGNTGSGVIQINKEFSNGKLIVQKVGNIAAKNMEFKLGEEEIAVFLK